ncbi:MAG: hypothetical protein WCP81_11680 [Actinomycetes bacterium]
MPEFIDAWARVHAGHAELCPDGSPCRARIDTRWLQSVDDPTVVVIITEGWTPERWAAFFACENAQTIRNGDDALAQHYDKLEYELFDEVWSGTYH